MTTKVVDGALVEFAPKVEVAWTQIEPMISNSQMNLAMVRADPASDFGPGKIPKMVGQGDNLCTFKLSRILSRGGRYL